MIKLIGRYIGILLVLLLSANLAYAQEGFGTQQPDKSAAVDIESTKRGLLIPRVDLTRTNVQAPVITPVAQSLLVYNENATAGANSVSPGYYYWDTNRWVRFAMQDDVQEITLAGDVTGLTGDTKVVALQGVDINSTAPVANQILVYDGTKWTPTTTTNVLALNGNILSSTVNGVEALVDLVSLVTTNETLTSIVLNADNTNIDYTDEDGNLTQLDLTAIVKNLETLTSVVENADGTFTFTDEAGNTTNIDVSNLETLTTIALNADNTNINYTDENGNLTQLDLTAIVKNLETLTVLNYNATDHQLTYQDENNTTHTLDLSVGAVAYDGATNVITYTNEAGGTIDLNLNNTDLSYDTTDQELVYVNNLGVTQRIDLGALVTANTTNALELTGTQLTSTVNGVASSVTLSTENLADAKTISGTSIDVTGGTGATLTDVTLEVKPGTDGQVMVTGGGIATWVDQSTIVPATTNELSSSDNTMSSNVNGEISTANIIDKVTNTITGTDLVTTVNSVASPPVDISGAIQAGQNTTSVVDGTNTTVTSTINGNNTEYQVNVSKADIQANQKTTVVDAGAGVTVGENTAGDVTTYTVSAEPSAITIDGDVTGSANATVVEAIQGTPVSATAPNTQGQALVFDGTNWTPSIPSIDAGNVTNAKNLSAGDASITVTDGTGATLVNTSLKVADGGITTDKIADDAVTALKLDAGTGDNGRIGVADDQGGVTYQKIEDIVQANQFTTTVVGGDDVIVTPTVVENNAEFLVKVKAAMPKFFYMPAIIFDTSVNGTGLTRNLYAEYKAQFTGEGNPTLISSAGATNAIPTLPANQLEYHITYYDTTVFANLSIDANGVLTYDIIGNATPSSYMTIVFVVK